MPGRTSTGNEYRYRFQGQEHDDEVKGKGNSVNYKYRMHDPRIGRFFAVDPLAPKYPHNSPYAFSENKVIAWKELEGLEAVSVEQVTRGITLQNGVTSFQGGIASTHYVGLSGGINYNWISNNRPGKSALMFNFSTSLNPYIRKNNANVPGVGSSSLLTIGYKHNRKKGNYNSRPRSRYSTTMEKGLQYRGFAISLTVEGHFDMGSLHKISTITRSFNFIIPIAKTNLQFTVGNDFDWFIPGMNFGYNGSSKRFAGAQDGGMTMHAILGLWAADYNKGIVFQAWGTTGHPYLDENGHRGWAQSSESRYGRALYDTPNGPGVYFGLGQLTYYQRDPLGIRGTFGISVGIEGQSMGAMLQDKIHLSKPFSKPGDESLLFDWDTNDKAKPTIGISYTLTLSNPFSRRIRYLRL